MFECVYATCTFVHVSYTAECIREWQEAKIVQIDLNAAFDRVNHLGILYKLCSVDIRGSVLSTQLKIIVVSRLNSGRSR